MKGCPFCNMPPDFPEAKDTFGTFYEAGCVECGLATISIQIIDCFERPRDKVHESWNEETLQYGIEYIEVARKTAIDLWESRPLEEQAKRELEEDIKDLQEIALTSCACKFEEGSRDQLKECLLHKEQKEQAEAKGAKEQTAEIVKFMRTFDCDAEIIENEFYSQQD